MAETTQPNPLFRVVSAEQEAPDPTAQQQAVATTMIRMALTALAQRFVVALSNLFTLLTVGSVFILCIWTPDPNTHQLVMLGGYSLFILLVNYLVIASRRK